MLNKEPFPTRRQDVTKFCTQTRAQAVSVSEVHGKEAHVKDDFTALTKSTLVSKHTKA